MSIPSSSESLDNAKEIKITSPVNHRPRWLQKPESIQKETSNQDCHCRPSTQDPTCSRPVWFIELMQPRRHSEVLIPTGDNSSIHESQIIHKLQTVDIAEETKAENSDLGIIMVFEEEFSETKSGFKLQKKLHNFLNSPQINTKKDLSRLFSEDDNQSLVSKGNKIPCSPEENIFRKKTVKFNSREPLNVKDLDVIEIIDDHVYSFDKEEDFIVPELPEGKEMIIELHTNWGDLDYIGMNGIEIFELKSRNKPIIEKIICETDSKSNPYKLVDESFRTHDDNHIWVTDYKAFKPVKIRIIFQEKIALILCRLWNYNKSRIYTCRGVRHAVIKLDEKIIFKGEVAKATGELDGSPERFGDTILFTTDEQVLESVAENDTIFQELFPSW